MTYTLRFTPSAEQDLIEAQRFYSLTDTSLGHYCAASLLLDIERLSFFAGTHPKKEGYYKIKDNTVIISAVLDNRKNPKEIIDRLLNKYLNV